MTTARIHSIDTFGTVDGPGIRFVLFLQGCALACQFCHNPDTWDPEKGRSADVEEILEELKLYLPYYRTSGGGITVTGGEPTLQASFVAQLFRECKRRFGLTTALDTSGFCEPDHAEELLEATDLVLLDLKHIRREKHIELTGQPNDRILRFARRLSDRRQCMWIRHVLLPGINDNAGDLMALGAFIGTLNSVEKVEVIPYHRMGVYKWQQLGLTYPLEGVPQPGEFEVRRAQDFIERGRKGSVDRPQP